MKLILSVLMIGLSGCTTMSAQHDDFAEAPSKQTEASTVSEHTIGAQDARVAPVYASNSADIKGFRFVEIQAGSVYEQLGFKPGDVWTRTDEIPMTSQKAAMEGVSALKDMQFLEIAILRNGHEVILENQ